MLGPAPLWDSSKSLIVDSSAVLALDSALLSVRRIFTVLVYTDVLSFRVLNGEIPCVDSICPSLLVRVR